MVSNLLKKEIVPVMIMLLAMDGKATELRLKEYHRDPVQTINLANPMKLRRPPVNGLSLPLANSTLSIGINELKNHPDLVEKALLSSLLANNEKGVSLLLPIFKQQQQNNFFYIYWGEAIIAHSKEEYRKAIVLYRKALAAQPQAVAVRLQLAITLFENYDNNTALHEFTMLKQRQDVAVTGDLEKLIDRYLRALGKRNSWKFNGNINYLDDSNVNNAAKRGTQIGGWTTANPESAKGAGYYVGISKKKPLISNFYSATEVYGFGKYYINNHKYDEATMRVANGVGYQNAKTEVTLLPFFEQSWYAGGSSSTNKAMKRYAHTYGGRIEINQIVSNNWLISSASEYGMQEYAKRDYLTGDNILFSGVITYAPDAKRYWFAGGDYYQENAREKSYAYGRKSVRIGWGKKWDYGINTNLLGSYALRNYFAKDFFGIKRNDKEYLFRASVWHENINFLGFTPVLVWSYRKNDSNHLFYRYEKNRIYFEIERKLR